MTPASNRLFIDVDVQRDFCEPDGALFVKGSPNGVFRDLVRHAVATKTPILGSVDSHAYDAWEFGSNDVPAPDGATKPNFPDHCVKGTAGWLKVEGTLPPRFRFLPNVSDAPALIESIAREIASGATQGAYFEKEVYSLFANPLAERFLATLLGMGSASGPLVGDRKTSVELVVFGVATDYCVKAAALGLAERGYKTTLVTDAIAGITPEGTRAALDAMKAAGVTLKTVAEILG